MKVPEVLLSGDHRRIERWRRRESLRATRERRPDLFARLALSQDRTSGSSTPETTSCKGDETSCCARRLPTSRRSTLGRTSPRCGRATRVRVHTKIKEGDKERIQVFEGVVIAYRKGAAGSSMFTVRKVSYGVGVERMFPVHSPRIDKIEVLGHGQVRRSRLYYLRALQGKAARLHQEAGPVESAAATPAAPAAPSTPATPTPA